MTIIELYRILFGRSALQNGSVIEMAEHGRAGGLSSGTPYKMVQDVPLKTIVDESDPDNVYVGEAAPGILSSESFWRIKKITKSSSVTTVAFADGNDNFDNEWDERATYSYS